MSNIQLHRESKRILKQMTNSESSFGLLCPILRVLQMRHTDLDISQATKVVRDMLQE